MFIKRPGTRFGDATTVEFKSCWAEALSGPRPSWVACRVGEQGFDGKFSSHVPTGLSTLSRRQRFAALSATVAHDFADTFAELADQ